MTVEKNLLYTKDHEWVRIDGNKAAVGISDYAQQALGDITFVDLPAAGRQIGAKETLAAVESVKAASDIYAPLSGKVIEVNEALTANPEAINTAPYKEGWIAVLELSSPAEKENLLDAAAYEDYLKTIT